MIRASAINGEFEMSGTGGEILAEICTAIRIFVKETEDRDKGAGDYIKAIIIDQIQSDFDASRVDLFKEEDYTGETKEAKLC